MIGDFSHALYLHFLRTGDLESVELAEQSVSFTSDFARTHESQDVLNDGPGPSKAVVAPEPRARAEIYRFHQTEGLLDSYLLTGSLRSLEAAKESLQELLGEDRNHLSHGPASLGNNFLCLARGYEVLGDQRLLERLNQLIDQFINSQSGDQHRQKEDINQTWAFGILWDGLLKAGRVTGRNVLLDQIRNEATVLLNGEGEWNGESNRLREYPQLTFLLAQGLATIDRDKRDLKYRDLSIASFRSFETENLTVEEPGAFGLLFGEAEKFISLIEFGRVKREQDGRSEP
jgi:hypothetical protein